MIDLKKRNGKGCFSGFRGIGSEKGIVLLVVVVLSAVALVIVTALLYMVTSGTEASGLHKGYRTAAEAGLGGVDVFRKVIDQRGDTDLFESKLTAAGLNPDFTTPDACNGELDSGATYTALEAKLFISSDEWPDECDKSLAIDPKDSTSYDMKIQLGTTTKYDVYAKITSVIAGNSGVSDELYNKGVVSTSEIPTKPIPYLYTIETLANKEGGKGEQARFSVLYQY